MPGQDAGQRGDSQNRRPDDNRFPPGARIEPVQPQRHPQPGQGMDAQFAQIQSRGVNIAAIQQMTDLHGYQHHGEGDGGGFHDLHHPAIGLLPEQFCRQGKGQGRRAIAIKQPVENRRCAGVRPQHQRIHRQPHRHHNSCQRRDATQNSHRAPERNPRQRRGEQGQRHGQPAFFQHHGQGQGQCTSGGGSINPDRPVKLVPVGAGAVQIFSCHGKCAGQDHGSGPERQALVKGGDPPIGIGQHHQRGQHRNAHPVRIGLLAQSTGQPGQTEQCAKSGPDADKDRKRWRHERQQPHGCVRRAAGVEGGDRRGVPVQIGKGEQQRGKGGENA